LLLCLLGLAIGISVALALYVAQKTVGIITIPAGFIVDTYPISMRWPDLVVVSVTVIIIGLLASLPPALTASRVPAIIQEE
ncbi:MAG: ABC transporter permease, partial [Bacteroidota bacterium]